MPIHKPKAKYKVTGGVRMSRASDHTTLLPLSGLLLALLMIASLLGLQGAIDRALTFQLSPTNRLTAPLDQALTGPPLIARQPVGRAAEAAASAEASAAARGRRSVSGAVSDTTPPSSPAPTAEAGVSSVPFVEPSTSKLITETPEKILITSIFKSKKVHSKHHTTKSTWGKPEGAQLFQSTSETLGRGQTVKPEKPEKTNGRDKKSGRQKSAERPRGI